MIVLCEPEFHHDLAAAPYPLMRQPYAFERRPAKAMINRTSKSKPSPPLG